MRRIFTGLITVAGLAVAMPALAQTAPETSKTETTKPAPKTDAKPESEAPTKAEDLDAFFKKGEEQANEGSSCQPPPEPIA